MKKGTRKVLAVLVGCAGAYPGHVAANRGVDAIIAEREIECISEATGWQLQFGRDFTVIGGKLVFPSPWIRQRYEGSFDIRRCWGHEI